MKGQTDLLWGLVDSLSGMPWFLSGLKTTNSRKKISVFLEQSQKWKIEPPKHCRKITAAFEENLVASEAVTHHWPTVSKGRNRKMLQSSVRTKCSCIREDLFTHTCAKFDPHPGKTQNLDIGRVWMLFYVFPEILQDSIVGDWFPRVSECTKAAQFASARTLFVKPSMVLWVSSAKYR